jgi:hypothetical protein
MLTLLKTLKVVTLRITVAVVESMLFWKAALEIKLNLAFFVLWVSKDGDKTAALVPGMFVEIGHVLVQIMTGGCAQRFGHGAYNGRLNIFQYIETFPSSAKGVTHPHANGEW